MGALAGLMLAAQGVAAIAVLPCAPPDDVVYRLSMTQSIWLPDGRAGEVEVVRRLTFSQSGNGNGYGKGGGVGGRVLEAKIDTIRFSPSGDAAERRLLAGFDRAEDPPLRFRLDPLMRVVGLEDADTHWRRFLARQRAVRGELERTGASTARADAMIAALEAAPEAERASRFLGVVAPVIAYCGALVPEGATMTAPDTVRILTTRAAAGVHQAADYQVDTRTGLLKVLERSVTLDDAPLRPLRERWRLEPHQS